MPDNRDVVIFQDKDVKITGEHVVIKCYYFPFGLSKTITFDEIKSIDLRKFVWKGKIWGMNITQWGYWMPGDLDRLDYDSFIAVNVDSKITPCFTTHSMNQVYLLLTQLLAKHRHRCLNSSENMDQVNRPID